MEDLEIIGIHRNKKFSPNHIGNDDAIFSLTMQALQKKGGTVRVISEDSFLTSQDLNAPCIFTMARQKTTVSKLKALEKEGVAIINSGTGIENCYRANMTSILIENEIPYPKSFIVPTHYKGDEVFESLPGKGFWIKRGDFHAIHKEDVTFAYTMQEAKEILREYALRDIPDAVISQHLVGDLVKFYGVAETGFFHWFYPYDNNHHKYTAYEEINGKSEYHRFDLQALKTVAASAAEVLGVDIYGGDAIVGKDGSFHIIDLNDWPSFAPCRDVAAGHIADRIFQKFMKLA